MKPFINSFLLLVALAVAACSGAGEERLARDAKIWAKGDVELWRSLTPNDRCISAELQLAVSAARDGMHVPLGINCSDPKDRDAHFDY